MNKKIVFYSCTYFLVFISFLLITVLAKMKKSNSTKCGEETEKCNQCARDSVNLLGRLIQRSSALVMIKGPLCILFTKRSEPLLFGSTLSISVASKQLLTLVVSNTENCSASFILFKQQRQRAGEPFKVFTFF